MDPGNDCLFCRIASGEAAAHALYESDKVLAFMDSRPIRTGHLQIIPRAHFDYYDSIPAGTLAEIMDVGQRLAPAMRRLFGTERVAFMFTGRHIAHAHAHVLPMAQLADAASLPDAAGMKPAFPNRPEAPDSQLLDTARRLRSLLPEARSGA